jgi:hypothetical protein
LSTDDDASKRGATIFKAECATCHGGRESDHRLYPAAEIGTEPHRADCFNETQASLFNKFLGDLEIPGYRPSLEPGIRSTQKYWAATLSGAWARSPYLHNGSVRTMRQLLTPPADRAKTFHRGSRHYDAAEMGYSDEGPYLFDTSSPGNSNSGHDYGTRLSAAQKQDLMEYLKTL